MKNGRHISEFYGVGVLLALVGGYLDAYTYIIRGGVFANAQTGNIVLFGIHLTNGEFVKAFTYLIPILSFVLGVFVVEMVKSKFNNHPDIHWHQIIIIFEILIITIVGFIPQGDLNNVANILISFTCAMQVEAFRRMNGNPFATTMCTGNLRSGTDNLFQYVKTKNSEKLRNTIEYYGIILVFICGASMGVLLTKYFGIKAVLFTLIGLISALLVLKSDDDKFKNDK